MPRGETCACGQKHKVITEIIRGRKLPDALHALETWVPPGAAVLVVSDLTTREVAGDAVAALLRGGGYRAEQAIIQSPNPHTDEQAIAQVAAAGPQDFALLIAVGSGTVTDVARMTPSRTLLGGTSHFERRPRGPARDLRRRGGALGGRRGPPVGSIAAGGSRGATGGIRGGQSGARRGPRAMGRGYPGSAQPGAGPGHDPRLAAPVGRPGDAGGPRPIVTRRSRLPAARP